MHTALASAPSILTSLLLTTIILGFACSHQSVHHLNKQIWVPGTQEKTLQMEYLNFAYKAQKDKNNIKLQGKAWPRQESIPDWASWSKDIWLGAYLCDRKGSVLAQDLKVLPAQNIAQRKGIAFEFSLEPKDMGSPGPVYITFGYRLVLTPQKNGTPGGDTQEKVFFASEAALKKF
ncbi:MAG: hypothetical protein ACOC43_12340 [Desulfohalobiaceae bacterium]